MLSYFYHTMRVSSHQIPWNVSISWKGLNIGLAAGDLESEVAARGVKGSHDITGRLFGPDQGGPLRHSHLLPLHPAGPEYHSK